MKDKIFKVAEIKKGHAINGIIIETRTEDALTTEYIEMPIEYAKYFVKLHNMFMYKM